MLLTILALLKLLFSITPTEIFYLNPHRNFLPLPKFFTNLKKTKNDNTKKNTKLERIASKRDAIMAAELCTKKRY